MADHVGERAAPLRAGIQQVIVDSTRNLLSVRKRLSVVEIVLAILAAMGLSALITRAATSGFDELAPWGYTAVAFGYVLSSVMAAPVLAVVLRLARSDWRRPISRVAEIPLAAGIILPILFIPMLLVVPSSEERRTIWTIWPWGAPHVFDAVLLVLLVVTGYAFLYLSAMPDFAVARDRLSADKKRGEWYRRLANGWRGTLKQWRVLHSGISLIGALYVILYVWTVSLLYSDYAMTLVPGWISAVLPAFAVISSLETGLAVVVLLMFALHRWGGMADYLTHDHFWSISKLQLTVALLWFYLWVSEFMIFWYGRLPAEMNVLELVMFDVYFIPFLLTFVFNFAAPLFILMWNPVRKTIIGPTIVACLVLIGTLLDRVRIFGAAYSIEDPTAHELETLPGMLVPDVLDVLIVLGAIGAAALLVILALRVVPLPSIWELGGGLPLRVRKRYLNTEVTVIAKPD